MAEFRPGAQLDALARQVALQLSATDGVTMDKIDLRQKLENDAFVLSAAVSGYAGANNLNTLYQKCKYYKSDFRNMRDAELLGNCTNLHTDATAVVSNLAPAITPSVLAAFNTRLNAFGAIMKNPQEAISQRVAATTNIKKMIPKIIATVLERQLDNDIVALTTTKPDFVAVYDNVRLINSSPTTTMALTINVLDQDGNALPNVQINIDNGAQTRTSSPRGYNNIQNLVAGTHTLTAEKIGFHTQTRNFANVQGETLELAIVMLAV